MQSRVETGGLSPRGDAVPAIRKALGRLRAMLLVLAVVAAAPVAQAGNLVEYVRDVAGNIVQIKRQSTVGLVITGVSPVSGVVGSPVTVYGTGFSATPANNDVRFNGTAAVVSAADSGSLAVTVPAGATTGRVTVTVGGSTATSPTDFVVTVPGAPTITSFSPPSGVAGTVVSVTGTGFDPPASVSVALNAATAAATVASPTALTFTVPASAASGRISVANAVGAGLSASDFVVVPAGYAAGDIARTVRLAPGGASADFQLGTPSTHGLILFDGAQGIHYTLQFDQLVYSPSNAAVIYKVYKPDNTLFVTGDIGYGKRPTIHLPKLPAGGSYSVIVSPGIATLSSFVSVAADPVLAVDGPPAMFPVGSASRTTRVVFAAAASQGIGVGVTGFALSGATTSGTNFRIYRPDGSLLTAPAAPTCFQASPSNPQGNCDGEFTTAEAGDYTMVAEPILGYSAGFVVQLNSEVSGALAADVPQGVSLGRVGQDARFTFAAAVGDSLAIDLSGIVPQPHAQPFYAVVLRPNGSIHTSGNAVSPLYGLHLPLGTIATAGNYTVSVDPSYGAYGTARVTLKAGPVLTTASAPAAFATSAAGESQRFRFDAAAGQNLSLGITGLAYAGSSSGGTTLTVYKPDGATLAYNTCYPATYGGRCKLTLPALSVAGTYSVAILPPAFVTLSGSLTLSEDLPGALTAGVPSDIAVSRPGQNARYTFPGTAGQGAGIEFAQLAMTPSGPTLYLYVLKPDGSMLGYGSATSGGAFVNVGSLPVTGTYSVLLDAAHGAAFTGKLTLDPGTPAEIDGAMQALATTMAGETVRHTFAGTSGTRVNLGLDGLAYSPAGSSATSLSVYRPDGGYVAGASCYPSNPGGGCEAAMPVALPSTGTYSVIVSPPAGALLAGGRLAVSTPLAGTLQVGGGEQTVAIARPAQTARYTFSGTAAQLLRLNWTGASVSIAGATAVTVSVLKPDGSTLTTASFGNGATGGMDIAALPVTGTYTVVFDPTYAATLSVPVALVAR